MRAYSKWYLLQNFRVCCAVFLLVYRALLCFFFLCFLFCFVFRCSWCCFCVFKSIYLACEFSWVDLQCTCILMTFFAVFNMLECGICMWVFIKVGSACYFQVEVEVESVDKGGNFIGWCMLRAGTSPCAWLRYATVAEECEDSIQVLIRQEVLRVILDISLLWAFLLLVLIGWWNERWGKYEAGNCPCA